MLESQDTLETGKKKDFLYLYVIVLDKGET